MSRLIRMDQSGHSTLAEWTDTDDAAFEAAVEEFRRQLDEGMWAAVPMPPSTDGRRRAAMVTSYAQIPAEAERVIFFPRAAGG
jgi:hypothetical protein